MLSIEEAKAPIDGGENMSNEEIVEIRDSLYELAEIALDQYIKDKKLSVEKIHPSSKYN